MLFRKVDYEKGEHMFFWKVGEEISKFFNFFLYRSTEKFDGLLKHQIPNYIYIHILWTVINIISEFISVFYPYSSLYFYYFLLINLFKKRKRKRKEVIYMLKSKSLKKSKVIVLLFERKKEWYLFRENKGY
jgi:hypothetical protein